MSIAERIKYEELISERLLGASGPMSFRKAEAIRGLTMPSGSSFPPEANVFPAQFISAPVSASVYGLIANEFYQQPDQRVTSLMISKARAYTSTLLGVDLDSVRVEVVPVQEWDDADTVEGFQVPVGLRDHLVFVPSFFSSPEELLCHELAHAGHTTARRSNGELWYFDATPVTAELVAHFVQYNYLLDHKDRAHFVAALAQLTTASYALAIYASRIYNNFVSFLGTEWAKEFRKTMPLNVLKDTYEKFQADQQNWLREVSRGIANILALLLIDEHEGMRRFISEDRIDKALETKLRSAFPSVDLIAEFANVNEKIFEILERFNLKK